MSKFYLVLLLTLSSISAVSAAPKPSSCYEQAKAEYIITTYGYSGDISRVKTEEDFFSWHFEFIYCTSDWGGECIGSLQHVTAQIDKASCDVVSLQCHVLDNPGVKCIDF